MKEITLAIRELTTIHEGLLALSKEKTDIIKEGSVEKMQDLLVRERKLARKAEKIENERLQLADAWFKEHDLNAEETTVTAMLEALEDEEDRKQLEEAAVQLTRVLTDLKAQEKLNFGLIRQSMQFIELSLDLLSPSIKNMNYGGKTAEDPEQARRSVFDSKA